MSLWRLLSNHSSVTFSLMQILEYKWEIRDSEDNWYEFYFIHSALSQWMWSLSPEH